MRLFDKWDEVGHSSNIEPSILANTPVKTKGLCTGHSLAVEPKTTGDVVHFPATQGHLQVAQRVQMLHSHQQRKAILSTPI